METPTSLRRTVGSSVGGGRRAQRQRTQKGRNKSQQESSQQHLTGQPSAGGHTGAFMEPPELLLAPTAPTATPAGPQASLHPESRHHRHGCASPPPPPASLCLCLSHTHTHTLNPNDCCSHASEFPELTHTLQQTCSCVLTLTHAVSLTRTGF